MSEVDRDWGTLPLKLRKSESRVLFAEVFGVRTTAGIMAAILLKVLIICLRGEAQRSKLLSFSVMKPNDVNVTLKLV